MTTGYRALGFECFVFLHWLTSLSKRAACLAPRQTQRRWHSDCRPTAPEVPMMICAQFNYSHIINLLVMCVDAYSSVTTHWLQWERSDLALAGAVGEDSHPSQRMSGSFDPPFTTFSPALTTLAVKLHNHTINYSHSYDGEWHSGVAITYVSCQELIDWLY